VPHGSHAGGEPLVEGGDRIEVTEDNKERYMELVCDDYLVGEVRVELSCVLQGFWEVLPQDLLKSSGLDAEELRMLVCGVTDINVDDWEKHAAMSVGTRSGEISCWFFDWLRQQSVEARGRVLAFCTGSSRLPAGGWDSLKDPQGAPIPFRITIVGEKTALPSAHTCFNTLVLPPVESPEELAAKMAVVDKFAGRDMLLV